MFSRQFERNFASKTARKNVSPPPKTSKVVELFGSPKRYATSIPDCQWKR
jgi:hypothetical protein